MTKYISVLILVLLPALAQSGQVLLYDSGDPGIELSIRETLSGPVTASLYSSLGSSDPNLFEAADVYLKIDDSVEAWWVHTPQPFDSMDIVEFAGSNNLLLILRTPVANSTAVLNLDNKSLTLIGSGSGNLIPSSATDPRIRLSGQRGFSDGVFWYSSVVDLQGRIIEFIPSGNHCVLIRAMVSDDTDLSRLQQPMDYCVGVER